MTARIRSRHTGRAEQSGVTVEPVIATKVVMADAEPSRRGSRRIAVRVAIGAVLAVVVSTSVVIAVATTVFGRSRSLPAPRLMTPSAKVTAAQLDAYHWRSLPNAPISLRDEGVVSVWTGSRMIIWGGTSLDGNAHSDGASFDPRSRTWRMLPPSPLGPRTGAAYAWTGSRLFIWGGQSGDADDAAFSDGATYDPSTGRWVRLPRMSVAGDALAQAVWTGNRVVLLTAPRGQHATQVHAHAYDPVRNSWTTLASIHITQTTLLNISTLVAGDRLYVWMPVQTVNVGLRTANVGFVYQVASNTWAPTSLLPTRDGYSVGGAVWTGDHVIFEPNGVECTCGGIAGTSTGTWVDPRTGAARALPAWQPPPSTGSTFSWTGAAIVAVGDAHAAAWDPSTGRWKRLTDPPDQGGAMQLWTGTELLIWGQLIARPSADPDAGSPSDVAHPTGLELTR